MADTRLYSDALRESSRGLLTLNNPLAPTAASSGAINMARWIGARTRALPLTPVSFASIALYGDSTQGLVGSAPEDTATSTVKGVANGKSRSMAEQLVRFLNGWAGRSDYARADGFYGCHTSSMNDYLLYDTSFTGTGYVAGGSYFAGPQMQFNAGDTTVKTKTTALPWDTIVVGYAAYSTAGTVTFASANGGSAVLDCSLNSGAGGPSRVRTLTGFTRGTTAANLTMTPDAGGIKGISFIEFRDSTRSQVVVRDCAWAGKRVDEWTSSVPIMATVGLLPCDFASLCWMLNDAGAGTSDPAFTGYMQTFITALAGSSVALTVPGESSNAIFGGNTAQRTLNTAIRNLAAANGYPIIDWPRTFGDYATGNSLGMYFNDGHPNDRGYGWKSSAHRDILCVS